MNAQWQAPFSRRDGGNRQLLVVCDHASNAIPAEFAELGVSAADRLRHIAWDPGALGVAEALALHFDAELIACGTSRLLIDVNRAPDNSELILARSDDVFIPGNETLSEADRDLRLGRYHASYHAAIAASLAERIAVGDRPLLVSVHSFEPVLAGRQREWPIGVLWKQDRAPLAKLIDAFAEDGLPVGDNQPYDGRVALGHTLEHHAIRQGLPHVLLELRNDQIATAIQQAAWAARIAAALLRAGMVQG